MLTICHFLLMKCIKYKKTMSISWKTNHLMFKASNSQRSFFQVAVKVLEGETIPMEQVVVLDMGAEGALGISTGG